MMRTGQEDPRNNAKIQAAGCNLWSQWTHIEIIKKIDIFTTPEIVNAEYARLLANGVKDIASDCTVEDGEAVYRAYGIAVKQMKDPVSGTIFVSPNYTPKPGQLVTMCYYWPEKKYTHFAPVTQGKALILDPIARGSNTIKHGYQHSMRVYDFLGFLN